MQIYIFLLICTLLVVKPTVNALFLSKFGVEDLPKAYLLVAIFAAVITMWYSRLLGRYALIQIIQYTIWASVACLIVFGILLRLNFLEGWVLYIFFVWVAIYGVLSASQFWILANVVFNAREAKRLFGFIGAGAIAGGIAGGYLTSIIAQFMSSEFLLFLGAFFLFLCISLTKRIWNNHVEISLTTFQKERRVRLHSKRPWELIRQSRHLTYLAVIVGTSVIVAKLVDYQFSDFSSSRISDPNELTAFFGFWFSTFNLISLFIQLFITRRVVGNYGVGSSLFILPTLLMLSAMALIFFPVLAIAILLKMGDASLKQSINKAALELLVLPIPMEIKNRTKTFIDVFVDSLATGVSGLILIFVVTALKLPSIAINLLIILFVGLWIYFASRVRREYFRSFKARIEIDGAAETELADKHPSILKGLKSVLEHGSEKQQLYVLRKIKEANDERLVDEVASLLNHQSSDIRAEAIQILYFFKDSSHLEKIRSLTRDPSQRVKIEAFEYLFAKDPAFRIDGLESFLNDPDPRVRGAALVSLAKETTDNPQLQQDLNLEKYVQDLWQESMSFTDQGQIDSNLLKTAVFKTVGYARMQSRYPLLLEAMSDESDLAREAVLAAGYTRDDYFLAALMEKVDGSSSDEAIKALASYGKGIVPIIMEEIPISAIGDPSVYKLPAVLGAIGAQPAVDALFSLMDHSDAIIRMEALRGLNHLRRSHPFLSFNEKAVVKRIYEEARVFYDTISAMYLHASMTESDSKEIPEPEKEARESLIRVLEKRLDQNLERIFRLLGLKYPPDDVHVIYKGIRSTTEEMRSSSIEYLDNLLEPSLKKILIPIVENAYLDSISSEALENLSLPIPDDYTSFATLLLGKDFQVKLAVLDLIQQLGDPNYIPIVEECGAATRNTKVYQSALKTIQILNSRKD